MSHNPAAAAVLSDMSGDFFCSGRSRLRCAGCWPTKMPPASLQPWPAALMPGASWIFRRTARHVGRATRRADPSGLGDTPVDIGSGVAQTMADIAANAGVDDRVVVFGSFLDRWGCDDWLAGDGSAAAKA